MSLFPIVIAILAKMLPLYAVMALGFIYGRGHKTAAEPVSFLQIYFIVPVVIVASLANMEFQARYLLLPVITLFGCCAVSLITFVLGRRIWTGNITNIMAYACGNGNTGYFGLPVALIILPPEIVGLFMMANVGFVLFDCTLGYYLVARGHFTARDSLMKLARLPLIYAFAVGVLLSILGQHVPDFAKDIARDFRGCYVVLGALMIGLGMSRLDRLVIESKLTIVAFAFKFLLWPVFALLVVGMDRSTFHLFTPEIHKILILMSVVPLPANAIPYAIQLKVQPEKTSTLVFLSTLFALFYVPLVMALWG